MCGIPHIRWSQWSWCVPCLDKPSRTRQGCVWAARLKVLLWFVIRGSEMQLFEVQMEIRATARYTTTWSSGVPESTAAHGWGRPRTWVLQDMQLPAGWVCICLLWWQEPAAGRTTLGWGLSLCVSPVRDCCVLEWAEANKEVQVRCVPTGALPQQHHRQLRGGGSLHHLSRCGRTMGSSWRTLYKVCPGLWTTLTDLCASSCRVVSTAASSVQQPSSIRTSSACTCSQ